MIAGPEISQAISLVKTAAGIAKETGKIPEYGKILELQAILLEIQGALYEKQKKIEELESENKELKEKIQTTKKMEFKQNAYYDEGDGPFCCACWDDKQKKIRLETAARSKYGECKVCKNTFKIKEGSSRVVIPNRSSYSDPF